MPTSKSNRLRLSDVRPMIRLVGECRDLGDDSRGWRTHLLAGLARLTGAGMGISAELGHCVRGPRRDLGTETWGWENGFDRAMWLRMLAAFQKNPHCNILMNQYIGRLPEDDGVCLSRADLIRDRDWYRSDYYQVLHRAVGVDATLTCFRTVPGAADEYSEVFLCRAPGESDFSGRAKAIVREVHAAIAPLVGNALARFNDPCPSDLPPRTRQVLGCLLEGDSDKQVAARLGMSGHTVNGHTKVLFRHFGVQTRMELLARWVRHGYGGRLTKPSADG